MSREVRGAWGALAVALLSVMAGCGHSTDAGDGGMTGDLQTRAMTLGGTRIAGGVMRILGNTSDDQVIVFDDQNGVRAISLAGGAPTTIDDGADTADVRGRAVFAFRDVDATSGIGRATSWTAAAGMRHFDAGSFAGLTAASADGAMLLLTVNANGDGTRADLLLAAADGSTTTTLFSQVSMVGACRPRMAFAGHYFVVTHCPSAATAVTVSSVDAITADVVELETHAANFFSVDRAGTRVLAGKQMGTTAVHPIAGGPPIVIDEGVAAGFFVPDGSAVVYRTAAGLLRRSSVSNPVPKNLVLQGVRALSRISPDGLWVLFASSFDADFRYGDLSLASTDTPGAPIPLVTDLTGTVFGDGFTDDSSQTLFVRGANPLFVGALWSQPVLGGPPAARGGSVWTVRAATGTRVVFNDAFDPEPRRKSRADLFVMDVSRSDAPHLIATSANADFVLSAAKDRVVYSHSAALGQEGLYAAPLL